MKFLLTVTVFCICVFNTASAQEHHESGNAAQANNPLANMTALNFHDYYMPKLSNAPNEAFMNTAWIRFAKPFASGKLLLRVSVPVGTVGNPELSTGVVKTTSGLGDVNAFLSYNFYSKPSGTIGIGPMISAPSATSQALGTGKWQAGFAFVAYIIQSPVLQLGGLVTWQTSIAGQSDRPSTSIAAVQPFYFWQLGGGTYLRGAPIWAFDFKNNSISIPLALGIGKIVRVGNTVFNLFVEPQYSVYTQGVQPQLQIFTGINLQFMGK